MIAIQKLIIYIVNYRKEKLNTNTTVLELNQLLFTLQMNNIKKTHNVLFNDYFIATEKLGVKSNYVKSNMDTLGANNLYTFTNNNMQKTFFNIDNYDYDSNNIPYVDKILKKTAGLTTTQLLHRISKDKCYKNAIKRMTIDNSDNRIIYKK